MRSAKGFTLVELMIVIAVIAILAAVVVPHFGEELKLAHETAAVQQIKTIQAMQAQFYSQFGHFAGNLTELGPPPPGAGLISKTLAEGKRSGYLFEIRGNPGGYTLTAVPETFGKSGRRSFFSDESHVIHESWTQQPADVNSPEI
jgi:prepilin-type N-terminal cleavage/methylation domain-containing protein